MEIEHKPKKDLISIERIKGNIEFKMFGLFIITKNGY